MKSFATAVLPRLLALVALAAVAVGGVAHADPPTPEDPMARHLFPPDLVMRHQREIGLDQAQRETIKQAVGTAQSRFLDMQWDMEGQQEKMEKLLAAVPVDETAVLAQADKVMDLERQVKRAQLALLVRIKNTLSAAQQEKLTQLRR